MSVSKPPNTANSGGSYYRECIIWRLALRMKLIRIRFDFLFIQVFADGFVPREVQFAVVEEHPTLLNVTLYPAKVGREQFTPAN